MRLLRGTFEIFEAQSESALLAEYGEENCICNQLLLLLFSGVWMYCRTSSSDEICCTAGALRGFSILAAGRKSY